MSQPLIADVQLWSEEQCREAIDTVFPKLIASFNKDCCLENKINVLCTLIKSFLPCIQVDEVEDNLFYPVITKVPEVFENLMNSIKHGDEETKDVKETRIKYIKLACQLLEALVSCLEIFDCDVSHPLDQMYSLPENTLQILIKAYRHCEDSDDIYGDMLELLSDPLGMFFNRIQDLQKNWMILLERMTLCERNEKDIAVLNCLCLEISNLCQLVCSVDVKISAALWKTYTKLIIRYKDCLKERLDVDLTLKFLSSYVIARIQHVKLFLTNKQEQDDDIPNTIKICSFHLKLIITICEKFQGYLGDCIDELFNLLLVLYDLSVSFYSSSPSTQKEAESILNCLVVGIEPLILHLLDERQFVSFVQNSTAEGFFSELKVSLCLLKIAVLDKIPIDTDEPEIHSLEDTGLPMFESTFELLKSCGMELIFWVRLPGVMYQGKAQRMVTLYEHVTTHLCAFVSKCCACHFHVLEAQMLKILLCGKDIISCLICDIWCFLSRYGSADLCYSHCCVLARLTTLITDSSNLSWIKFLLGRLVKFLSSGQKKQLQGEYEHLASGIFHEDEFKDSEQQCAKYFCLLDNGINEQFSPDEVQFCLHKLDELDNMMTKNPVNEIEKKAIHTQIALCLIEIASSFVTTAEGKQLLDLLQFARIMWAVDDDAVHLALISFLKQWPLKRVASCAEQTEILNMLGTLFAEALSCKNYILQREVLCVFSKLACLTSHRNVIIDCSRKASTCKNILKDFLKKVPRGGFITDEQIAIILKEQEQILAETNDNKFNSNPENNWLSVLDKITTIGEVLLSNDVQNATCDDKRAEETTKESNFKLDESLKVLSEAHKQLEGCQPLPLWVLDKVKELCKQLSHLS